MRMGCPCRAPLGARERMRRDKELHRLGLRSVEGMARDVLVELVQVGGGEWAGGDDTPVQGGPAG